MLREAAEPYAERVAIGGTGIAVAGFVGHGVGLLARAAGDLDTAVEAFTAARERSEEAGFAPFAVAAAAELARTLRERDRPGDEASAAALEAEVLLRAGALGMSLPRVPAGMAARVAEQPGVGDHVSAGWRDRRDRDT
jgi:hypothetical protein